MNKNAIKQTQKINSLPQISIHLNYFAINWIFASEVLERYHLNTPKGKIQHVNFPRNQNFYEIIIR